MEVLIMLNRLSETVKREFSCPVASDCIKYHCFEFTHIAWELIGGQECDQFSRKGRRVFLKSLCCILDEVIQQIRYVLKPLLQRRNMKVMGAEPEVKILSEFALAN
jgi:hypothetical protein